MDSPTTNQTAPDTELEQSFDESEGAVLVSYAGLTVKEDSALRDDLAAHGVEFRMVRNNLAKRVMVGRGLAFPEDIYTGNTALAYGDAEQAILAAKEWKSTVLLVTYQPSILRSVDKLMVLQEGRIQAFGPRDEILNKLLQASISARIPAGGVS